MPAQAEQPGRGVSASAGDDAGYLRDWRSMNDPCPINDTRKAELLSTTVEHVDISSFDARPIIDAMRKMSFTSRDPGRAADIYNQMLDDKDCSVCLIIAGSTSAGGCMDVYGELVRNNMVDAIVATGASIVDMDFFEALGFKHYQALEIPDDDTLRALYIDRIYDTYIDEEELQSLRPHDRRDRRHAGAAPLFLARVHPRDGQVAVEATPRRRTASSRSPTSMTCRSSARPSPTARPASGWSSTRSRRSRRASPT